MEAGGAPGAGSLGASTGLPPPGRGFSEESQKPVEMREGEAVSPEAGPQPGPGGVCGLHGGQGEGRPHSACFTAQRVGFPSWTVLNLSHYFLL